MSGVWTFLFDLDGTILDTTDLIMKSFIHTFREELGETVSREELMLHFGRPLEDQFRVMRPTLSDERVSQLVRTYREHNEMLHDDLVTVVPGAFEGIKTLFSKGFPLGIVTSKRYALTAHGLQQFGMLDFFQVVVHSDSTEHHKPHPEPVEYALRLIGAEPSSAVYVGDSPYDMMAGGKAGARPLGLVYNTFSESTLREAGAIEVVDSWPQVVDTLLSWANEGITIT